MTAFILEDLPRNTENPIRKYNKFGFYYLLITKFDMLFGDLIHIQNCKIRMLINSMKEMKRNMNRN